MLLHGGRDVGVRRPRVRAAVDVDEVRRAHRDAGALVGRLLERDVEVQAAAEVDDPERQQQQDRRDERKLGEALRTLALEPCPVVVFHGFPWIVKCSLKASFSPLPNRLWIIGVMSAKFISSETLMSPRRHELSVGGVGRVPSCSAPPGDV